MIAALRDGRFISPDRIRIYSLMLLAAYALGTFGWFATAHGLLDWQDRPLGTDFAQVWVAGGEVLAGHPAMPFDNDAHLARQREVFGPQTAVFTWGYPPPFLAVAAALALLPYLAAYFLWQGLTYAAYAWATWRFLPRREALLPILAFPAVFVNFGHGQTGFASAALLGGGLALLERRPALAGVLFGLAAFKPQLGILLPIALLAGGHWRSLSTAAATVVALAATSWLAFGPETFQAFWQSLPYSRVHGLEYSNTGFYKMQSLFAAVRQLGGPVPLAYAAHGALLLALAAGVAAVWHGARDMRLKAATMLVAATLATPYGFDYDLVLIGPALAALVALGLETGFRPWERSLLLAAWIMPIVARTVTQVTLVPIGLLVLCSLMGMILARGLRHSAPWTSPIENS